MMDEHGLPIVGAGVDYSKVPALDHKNTLVFLNKFVINTAQFLNKFSTVCEERLAELLRRIQRLDISLNILEAKLASIPDLEGVQSTSQYEPPAAVASAGSTTAPSSSSTAPPSSSTTGPPPPSQQPPPPSGTAASDEPLPPPQPDPAQTGPSRKAKDDPRYQRFFKMKRLGVNPLQLAMEMKRHGLNPDVLEDEDAELPSEEQGADASFKGTQDSSESASSSEDSDESFDSD